MSNALPIEKKKVEVSKARLINMDAELRHAVSVLMKPRVLKNNSYNNSLPHEENLQEVNLVGFSYHVLSALLMLAFTFEAAMNRVGSDVFGDEAWKLYERKHSAKDKLQIICHFKSISSPWKKEERPFSTLKRLFEFRNTLAHGKPEVINNGKGEVFYIDGDDLGADPSGPLLADWQKLIADRQFFDIAEHDVKQIVDWLYVAIPELKGSPFSFGVGSYSFRFME